MNRCHIIGYIEAESQESLKSVQSLKKSVSKVCKIMGLKVVGENYHRFKWPEGITYCFILSQSHFIIHTWPEESIVFFDIFTCNENLNESRLVAALSEEFNGKVKRIDKVAY